MPDFTTKRGDTLPSIPGTFSGGSGRALDGATVKMLIYTLAGVQKVNAACVIENPTTKVVRYDFAPNDVNTAGDYEFEFEVTYADGLIETFPKDHRKTLRIKADLG